MSFHHSLANNHLMPPKKKKKKRLKKRITSHWRRVAWLDKRPELYESLEKSPLAERRVIDLMVKDGLYAYKTRVTDIGLTRVIQAVRLRTLHRLEVLLSNIE